MQGYLVLLHSFCQIYSTLAGGRYAIPAASQNSMYDSIAQYWRRMGAILGIKVSSEGGRARSYELMASIQERDPRYLDPGPWIQGSGCIALHTRLPIWRPLTYGRIVCLTHFRFTRWGSAKNCRISRLYDRLQTHNTYRVLDVEDLIVYSCSWQLQWEDYRSKNTKL